MTADLPTVPDEVYTAAVKAYCHALPGFPSDSLHDDLSADAVGFRAALAVAFAAGQAAAYDGGSEVWETRYQYGDFRPMLYGKAQDQAEAMQDVEAARGYGYEGVTVRMRRLSAWVDVPVATDGEVAP